MTQNQGSQDPIILELGATAEPRTCGSCVHFERREVWNWTAGGYCNIKLPPWVAKEPYDPESKPPSRVNDNWTCDLHKHTGKAYIVSKLVQP